MIKSAKIGLLGATTIMAALSVALPAMAKGGMGIKFESVDTNADGFVDKAELIAAQDARFDAMDGDKDGAVSKEEMMAYGESMRKKHAEGAEHAKDHAARFKALDTDGNGSLSEAEFKAAMDKRHEQMGKDGKKHHAGKDGRRADRQGRMIARLDANKDGKVTKEELGTQMTDRIMSHMDKDNDGRISKEEADAAREKRKK